MLFRSKMVPAITDVRLPHPVHMNLPSPSRRMPTQPSSCLRSYADVAVSWRSPLFEHQASRQVLALEKYPHTFRPAMISSLRRSRSVQRPLADAREVIVVQLQLLGLMSRRECDAVSLDPATRVELIGLMARVVVAVFPCGGGKQ